ncbi:MAG: hypothetical protein JRC92_01590 [Deltaproteobacteria bacterium]|nr:hypothetical protein [Deltaproteobacteria bacterium]
MAGLEDRFYAQAEKLFVRGKPDPESPGRAAYPTLEEIAVELKPDGPSVSTLHRWSRKGGWGELRERWRKVGQDLPTRLLAAAERRLAWLEENPEEAKSDELFKLKSIFAALRADLAGGEEGAGVDRLAVWLEMMTDLIEDLKELEPEGVNLIHRHFDALVKKAKGRYA